jgi:hypothetical protein
MHCARGVLIPCAHTAENDQTKVLCAVYGHGASLWAGASYVYGLVPVVGCTRACTSKALR